MSFTPLARFRNFTVNNLKLLLEIYPDMAGTMEWQEAVDEAEEKLPGYKRTAYQQACQFGIEARGESYFKIQQYLFAFDDVNLERYLTFWIKTYYAPNPYVQGNDSSFIIYCEIVKEIIASPGYEIEYDNFFERRFGGKSNDILLNAIKSYAEPLKVKYVKGNAVLFIENEDIAVAKKELDYIEKQLPIGNPKDKREFFERFSYDNFCDFYGIDRTLEVTAENEVCVAEKINFYTGYNNKFPHNRIVFGAPGTGKSHTLNRDRKELLGKNSSNYERVTFHPNYLYGNFVGAYKPVSGKGEDGEDTIRYEYVPGPFMRVLVKALENSKHNGGIQPFLLLIEEINRANVAAVFGEVFQLLDRSGKNVSEYTIQTTEDMKKYLAKELKCREEDVAEIRIPDNMFIWATMNSADQGVFPMDTAFKRRWEFEYIGINDAATEAEQYTIPIAMGENRKYVKWNALRMKINDILLSDDCKINEDKLLGPFFISKNMLENAMSDEDKFVKAFESKVIMYLFEDVMKMRPANIFRGHQGRMIYSEICSTFEKKGEGLFGIIDLPESTKA